MDKKQSQPEEIGGYCHLKGCNNWAEPNTRCGKCNERICATHATEIRGEAYCADCMKEYPEVCDRCGGPTIDGLELREIGRPDPETGYQDRELLCRVCAELPDSMPEPEADYVKISRHTLEELLKTAERAAAYERSSRPELDTGLAYAYIFGVSNAALKGIAGSLRYELERKR